MNQPPSLANIIVQIIRRIAERENVSLERAAEIFKTQIHRRAEELRQQRQHERN